MSDPPVQGLLSVDDADPQVRYSGNWDLLLWPDEYNGTMHSTSTSGSTMTFQFIGLSISVYGPIGNTAQYGTPTASFVIDDQHPVTYTAPNNVTGNALAGQLFYSSGPIDAGGLHTLTMTLVGGGTLFVDYMQFFPLHATGNSVQTLQPTVNIISFNPSGGSTFLFPSNLTPGPSNPTNSPGITPGPGQPTSSGDANHDAQNTQPGQPTPKSSNTKYIVAGVVSGIVVLILIILGCILFLRRRKRGGTFDSNLPENKDYSNGSSTAGLVPAAMYGQHDASHSALYIGHPLAPNEQPATSYRPIAHYTPNAGPSIHPSDSVSNVHAMATDPLLSHASGTLAPIPEKQPQTVMLTTNGFSRSTDASSSEAPPTYSAVGSE